MLWAALDRLYFLYKNDVKIYKKCSNFHENSVNVGLCLLTRYYLCVIIYIIIKQYKYRYRLNRFIWGKNYEKQNYCLAVVCFGFVYAGGLRE